MSVYRGMVRYRSLRPASDPICLARVHWFPLVSIACTPAAEPMVGVLVLGFVAVSQA